MKIRSQGETSAVGSLLGFRRIASSFFCYACASFVVLLSLTRSGFVLSVSVPRDV